LFKQEIFMSKKRFMLLTLVSLAMLIGIFVAVPAFAAPHNGAHNQSGGGTYTLSTTTGATTNNSAHNQNLFTLPKAAASHQGSSHRQLPFLTGHSSKFAQAKAAASHNKNAPVNKNSLAATPQVTSPATAGFQGMADSATICPYFGGCQPPDMALATSPKYVLQGVNSSYAIYDTSGNAVVGPINDQVWYGIPNPPTNCDPYGAFLSDPRAFYDPNTGLFWTATLQIEGALGVGSGCPLQSLYWVANLNLKTGMMHVYSFDMTLGTTNIADYTQLGFNKDTVAFTANMFDNTGTSYLYAETLFADKKAMATGASTVPTDTVSHYAVNGPNGTDYLDTVQPVETITPSNVDPGVLYLVNTFNMNGDPYGDNCLFTACHDYVVWSYNHATHNLVGSIVSSSANYVTPPYADQPGCIQCIETIDTRITGTPVYSVGSGNGLISFSLDTAVNNGFSVVPGILWGQAQPFLSGGSLIGALVYQGGYISYSGDQAASFGAMMQDKNGRLVMVFDTMSVNLNPSILVTSHLVSDPLGNFRPPRFLIKGTAPFLGSRWGDFEAASYDGFTTNHIWVASQYSVGDWATFIVRV
jgi:hypothetical protein